MEKEYQSLNAFSFGKIILPTICVALICTFAICEATGIKCGTKNVNRPLIKGGDRILRGEWPFIVAVYRTDETKYFCGGTLISAQHVLTAAHCIQQKYWPIKLTPAKVTVSIGAHNLTAKSEGDVVQRNVSEIYVHPDWDVYDDRYDADIAILVLSANVTFTSYIRPICIPADGVLVDGASIDVEGSVVGWGLAEKEIIEEIPKQAVTSALNDSYCYRRDYGIVVISSARTFCGGDGVGMPNKGDSGGGFFVLTGSAWVQYGIISVIRTNSTGHITTNSLAAYTNVKMFKNWIVETVTQSGGEVGEAIEIIKIKIDLNCVYSFDEILKSYGCTVQDALLHSDNNEVGSFTGSYYDGKTAADVDLIQFKNGTMFYIPDGIGVIFKHLKKVEISESLSIKFIRRSNLWNMESLVDLIITLNDIETFEEDLLWDLPNLEIFKFSSNNLKVIKGKCFEGNRRLREVWLNSNRLEVVPENLFENNFLLEKIFLYENYLKTIDGNTFVNSSKLREVYLKSNQLEFIPANLFENNLLLEKVNFAKNILKLIDERTFERNLKLRAVWLNSNRLEFIPQNLFANNYFLENVFLWENNLKTIDGDTFVNNLNLLEVFLQLNKLEFLPANLFRNNLMLKIVRLENNFFKIIDEKTFEGNKWLKEVWLHSNQLEFIPENLFQNQYFLEKVFLNANSLKTIGENTFVNNSKLREVYLQSNKLKFLPGNLFEIHVSLMKVSVAENFLKLIDGRTFSRNRGLREVYLQSNQLEFLPAILFQNNFLLKAINLSKNYLNLIDERTFERNRRLKAIWLHSNRLELLPEDLFRNNSKLVKINVSNNSLKIIDINFTGFKYITQIWLYDNFCIDGAFGGSEDPTTYRNEFRNLTEFQTIIRANCSSVKP